MTFEPTQTETKLLNELGHESRQRRSDAIRILLETYSRLLCGHSKLSPRDGMFMRRCLQAFERGEAA